jgi:hypothetical protein
MAQKNSDAQIVMTDSMSRPTSCPGQATKPVPTLFISDRAFRRLSVNYFTHGDKIFFTRPFASGNAHENINLHATCTSRLHNFCGCIAAN